MTAVHLLQVITAVHVGEGAQVGAVGLPVARERHTGWPFIPGSSMKGALRAWSHQNECKAEDVARAFGPEVGEPLAKGLVSFGDATLLALPVRTAHNTFALITSPLALGRLARTCAGCPPIPVPQSPDRILVGKDLDLKFPATDLAILEDLCCIQDDDARVDGWAGWLKERWLGDEAPLGHLAVVHDDLFAHATRAWLPTRTRNAIKPETGVVEGKKLFTVEYLPPETLLWTYLDDRNHGSDVLPLDGDAWAIGGHKTTGSGRVTLWQEKR